MVNNKQVNLWRGDSTPPTIYHIWIKDNRKLLIYDGKSWVVFLDNKEVIDVINEIQEKLDNLESQVQDLGNKTINNKKIKTNPVLDGSDLLVGDNGNFISKEQTISQSIKEIDSLLTTQIIE